MTRALFIRHAETDMAGRFCGHSDPELNERGQAQATDLASRLSSEPLEAVFSSDLHRARATANALVKGRDIPVRLRTSLREIYFGDWEGLKWEQIEKLDPALARRWTEEFPRLAAPGGETFHAFETRVLGEVSGLIEKRRGTIAVVTHAGVIRVLLQRLSDCTEAEAWERTRSYGCIFDYEFTTTGANK